MQPVNIPLLKPSDIDVRVAQITAKGASLLLSFEAQVETLVKARAGNVIMSIEASVDELYGDTKDAEWKAAEVQRLKEETNYTEMPVPAVNLDRVINDDETA